MQITRTQAPKSSIQLEIELPPDRLDRAVGDAVRRLSRRTRVPGFRPGKAPRPVLERALGPGVVLDEAVEHLVQDAYREALVSEEILPLANADVEIVQAEEGKPLVFKATVPIRPDVELGDVKHFNFGPEIDAIDDARIDQVVEELRDQNATLGAVEDRGAQDGDYAVISFVGSKDGEPFEGGSSDRMPLILGQERLIPGFEANLIGLKPGDATEFDITFPGDYGEASLAGQTAHFKVELKELREKIQPELDDDFLATLGDFDSLDALRADVRRRLEANALDRARHGFADKIIEYAVANATVELPDVLVDQEVEVMHDEFRASLARQGITEDAYLKAVEKTGDDLHGDFRPNAERRVKTLLVLSKVAEVEGTEISDADVEAEVARGRERYADDSRTTAYFDSERGRSFIRSTLRRSRVVEAIIDAWLAEHPEHPPLPHLEDGPASALEGGQAEANASIGATDPGSVMAGGGHDHDHPDHLHPDHGDPGPEATSPAATESVDEPATAG
jgi:trigger factor